MESGPVVVVPEEKDLEGTWRNFPVYPGMHVWVRRTGRLLVWDGTDWRSVPRHIPGKKYRSRRVRVRADRQGLHVRLGGRSRHVRWPWLS